MIHLHLAPSFVCLAISKLYRAIMLDSKRVHLDILQKPEFVE